jgi:hypothetical protein
MASGWSVKGAGDVNGDGFDDIIVGDPYLGAAYVVFGKASGFAGNLNMSQLNGLNGFASPMSSPTSCALATGSMCR